MAIMNLLNQSKKYVYITTPYLIVDNELMRAIENTAIRGVDIRIIYDDMGCHGKLKNKTKKAIKKLGIKMQPYNKFVPVFNLAQNLRDHRKIVVVDGKVAFTGGANLADEYINEKQIYGYWKDAGIKIEGNATNNLTLAFLRQWEYLTKQEVNYESFLINNNYYQNDSVVVPFVSGPEYTSSVAKEMFVNIMSSAEEKLYIFTPYFVPEETITNILIAKAKSGVDVRIILPDVADKKYVYVVSRDYAERLISSGVKVYTMTNSFVHSKVIANEHSCIVGSINTDLRSFYQQFESAVYTNDQSVLTMILTKQ